MTTISSSDDDGEAAREYPTCSDDESSLAEIAEWGIDDGWTDWVDATQ